MLYRDDFTNEFTENDHELQRTERKMTISWSFSYNSLLNSMEKTRSSNKKCYIEINVLTRRVIKGLQCISVHADQ